METSLNCLFSASTILSIFPLEIPMLVQKLQKLVPQQLHPLLGDIYHRCRGVLHLVISKGNEYTCPFCEHSFSRFLSSGYKHSVLNEKKMVGGGYRKNNECPYCGSLDRERLVSLFLNSNNMLHSEMNILHIAPEKSLQRMFKRKQINTVSADLNSPLASIKMDIQQIQFPDNYFDAIICNHVLEHIPDDYRAMKELYRVLKPGGWAILQVPYSPLLEETFEDANIIRTRDRERVFGQSDHVRIYGLDYVTRLHSSGFTVTTEKMDAAVTKQYALNAEEVIFYCKK
jgi:hypothetical protein